MGGFAEIDGQWYWRRSPRRRNEQRRYERETGWLIGAFIENLLNSL